MWWIAGGVALLALVVLVVVVLAVAGHLRPLERAMRRMRLRAEQAEGLQTKLLTLQEQLTELQQGVEQAAARSERVKAGRTEATS
jgi:uncharacterized protein YlxW (UPF0749 family)